ncbi:branched-chain amino acid ABC transporter permease [Xinfangfangia sp. D13-10-4-6]|uniref:branched-chain amino acid ABC transporter permease n=1 Tax=Pseudogemmobacter hezensis TaxID=2737662 RepID=UPI0015546906|nr:branched-chain amino acid ABC transporter permease [Pseudogemmobacter hezensis]NPD16729.1 branched-chain amino acid ABC transporter permease [Pseudogemmobacter hezensis]
MDSLLVQHIINWAVMGSIYTLIAIGFSLLFGLLNVIHFSHGDVSMIAPFVALGSLQLIFGAIGGDAGLFAILIALALAIVATGLVGVGADRLVIRRFRKSPAMMALVATVALGTAIRELIRGFYPQGSNPKAFPTIADGFLSFGGGRLPLQPVVIILTTIAVVALVWFLLHKTPTGTRIRAVAEDPDTALLMSIRPDRIFAFTFFLASAVGALGALFFASHAGVVRFDFGVQLGLIGFSAAVIGGLGSMSGAVLGALAIAAVESVVQATVPDGASYRLVFAFLLVILMLCLRPSGILGKTVQEKV